MPTCKVAIDVNKYLKKRERDKREKEREIEIKESDFY